ncbi:hypothetical protein [Janthinobacterium sp. FW305-128]|uniref:hypothetical protein n=1 Tax=Janthinobacterium sp. FW305-128 TaxID=2775055 RepID=UPI001E2AD625|nr:hypothetical protein [Janthinobacterium sp. FW305-128]MCC7684707.1 hypothetical protein [Janthinobacterium sp. FW305-128]
MAIKSESLTRKIRKRGPAPSGDSRAEIEKRSKQKGREKRQESGLVDLKGSVTKEVRDELAALKETWGLSNIGQVIEKMVKDYKK